MLVRIVHSCTCTFVLTCIHDSTQFHSHKSVQTNGEQNPFSAFGLKTSTAFHVFNSHSARSLTHSPQLAFLSFGVAVRRVLLLYYATYSVPVLVVYTCTCLPKHEKIYYFYKYNMINNNLFISSLCRFSVKFVYLIFVPGIVVVAGAAAVDDVCCSRHANCVYEKSSEDKL